MHFYARIQTMDSPKVVFMGSPDFAVPALVALAEKFAVAGVVTQPDRPSGRGRNLASPPVKILADELCIPVLQPQRLHKEPAVMDQLRAWNPDLIVVTAFGQILRPEVLDLPQYGCLNVHASLLPRWRGAAPVNAAILHGDAKTGITIMKMDPGLDTGPLISKRAIPIEPDDTAGSMFDKLATLGAELLIESLPAYLSGDLVPQPQDEALATYAPMLHKADGELDFNQPAVELARKVRAFNPWPGAFFQWSGAALKIQAAHSVEKSTLSVGIRGIHQNLPAVGTAKGLLVLDKLQPAGKKSMPGEVFLRGAKDW